MRRLLCGKKRNLIMVVMLIGTVFLLSGMIRFIRKGFPGRFALLIREDISRQCMDIFLPMIGYAHERKVSPTEAAVKNISPCFMYYSVQKKEFPECGRVSFGDEEGEQGAEGSSAFVDDVGEERVEHRAVVGVDGRNESNQGMTLMEGSNAYEYRNGEGQDETGGQCEDTRSVSEPLQIIRTEVPQESYDTYNALVKNFYTIDPTTMIDGNELNADEFMERDLSIEKTENIPQILIYHTHSQEGFADSVQGDPGTTVVAVGDRLASILEEKYGYCVIHDKGEYDKPKRDEAYSRALPALEKILAENPSIEVMIDLHRDEIPKNTHLVTEIDGKKTARFMFFNGLSRTKKTGKLKALRNNNLAENLAFSFQMEKKAMEYYPNLTRKIYLKGYRYNLHLLPRSLLVELGAQNNTLEEAMNACEPLAHLLDMVLSGEE